MYMHIEKRQADAVFPRNKTIMYKICTQYMLRAKTMAETKNCQHDWKNNPLTQMMRFPPKSNTQNKESQISDHTTVCLPYGFPDQSNELWETKTKIKFPWEHRRNIFMLYMHTYNCNMGYRFTSIPLPLENYWLHKQATKIKREKTNKNWRMQFVYIEKQQCKSTQRGCQVLEL